MRESLPPMTMTTEAEPGWAIVDLPEAVINHLQWNPTARLRLRIRRGNYFWQPSTRECFYRAEIPADQVALIVAICNEAANA